MRMLAKKPVASATQSAKRLAREPTHQQNDESLNWLSAKWLVSELTRQRNGFSSKSLVTKYTVHWMTLFPMTFSDPNLDFKITTSNTYTKAPLTDRRPVFFIRLQQTFVTVHGMFAPFTQTFAGTFTACPIRSRERKFSNANALPTDIQVEPKNWPGRPGRRT